MKQFCYTLETINDAADFFLRNVEQHTVFAFRGAMGAGKTSLISAICDRCGVTDVVNSPTFSLVNEYDSPEIGTIYHFDFYRINKLEEAFDLGYEDYFYSGSFCLIEWPEKVEELLPIDAVNVSLTVQPDGSRLLSID